MFAEISQIETAVARLKGMLNEMNLSGMIRIEIREGQLLLIGGEDKGTPVGAGIEVRPYPAKPKI